MLKMILVTTTLLGFYAAAMAQDAKAPATTGPAAQGDNMAKGDSMSKKKTTKSTKMKKTDTK